MDQNPYQAPPATADPAPPRAKLRMVGRFVSYPLIGYLLATGLGAPLVLHIDPLVRLKVSALCIGPIGALISFVIVWWATKTARESSTQAAVGALCGFVAGTAIFALYLLMIGIELFESAFGSIFYGGLPGAIVGFVIARWIATKR